MKGHAIVVTKRTQRLVLQWVESLRKIGKISYFHFFRDESIIRRKNELKVVNWERRLMVYFRIEVECAGNEEKCK